MASFRDRLSDSLSCASVSATGQAVEKAKTQPNRKPAFLLVEISSTREIVPEPPGRPRRDINRTWDRLIPIIMDQLERKRESQEKIAA